MKGGHLWAVDIVCDRMKRFLPHVHCSAVPQVVFHGCGRELGCLVRERPRLDLLLHDRLFNLLPLVLPGDLPACMMNGQHSGHRD
ncbi:hypothetical protein E2C01_019927 [Portunus trituberculatus]|uniref:Uncharacterized protein n=1 Tax=Portunus trituberculatus TaxID=210409 RepID=A0A5B7E057_PORTR|nr:hypothetical protein [Portunus trituberculatus]